jgi:hypothetical protein
LQCSGSAMPKPARKLKASSSGDASSKPAILRCVCDGVERVCRGEGDGWEGGGGGRVEGCQTSAKRRVRSSGASQQPRERAGSRQRMPSTGHPASVQRSYVLVN